MRHPYPILLDVRNQHVLIVGGGAVALRKVRALLEAGAKITVISPTLTSELEDLEVRGEIVLFRQNYQAELLSSVVSSRTPRFLLAIAATNDQAVNHLVYEDMAALGIPVNIVDQPELSRFIVPSVVRRGKLLIAVSTGGASPSAARRIAKEIELSYGDEYEMYLDFLSEVRQYVQQRVDDKTMRQRMFKEMLEWDVLDKIRSGSFGIWKQEMFAALARKPDIETIQAFSGR
ncbi:precorrin-2 dehydrogenase/sirohydrochlorin ferrochelatase family protein [Paenibacillus hexagrammi]|uniref:precorrin-2 dehydrogenase n=1 Tax=Paenibacillus hexagrammi TaxID=2908839 RepID=A0ABY3SGG1_9BACL|nr:bifunctional precorrin-2 dehydrogenase/sirohydrochlorin ferrochelatase [Paenibacillus sp. YPD9-1]UJF32022.1 bifunctional precorrin-2 dehydrogenase/sirohydrochlorin ferrochelatase [Paenibacillus sp. YPD9-1]